MSDVIEAMVGAALAVLVDPTTPGPDIPADAHLPEIVEATEMALIAALRAASAAGWRMVPVEATEEMCERARDTELGDGSWSTRLVWTAMLAAAPKLEEQG